MNPKTIEILITKLGLTPVQAVWVMGLSEKHAIWIANQLKTQPELYPKAGGDFKKILKWKKNNDGLNIGDYNFQQALKASTKSENTLFNITKGSLANKNIVAVCTGTPWKWVELKTEGDCIEEGVALRHCLRNSARQYRGRGKRLFSLRNEDNRPILTLQIDGNKIGEYRSKGNGTPDASWTPCFKFLEEKLGLKISISSKYAHGFTKQKERLPKLVKGDLIINDGEGKGLILPEGLKVTGNLVMNDSWITNLPKKLEVGKDLILEENDAVKIPDGTKIGGNLIIESHGLQEIDLHKIKLGGKIIIR